MKGELRIEARPRTLEWLGACSQKHAIQQLAPARHVTKHRNQTRGVLSVRDATAQVLWRVSGQRIVNKRPTTMTIWNPPIPRHADHITLRKAVAHLIEQVEVVEPNIVVDK